MFIFTSFNFHFIENLHGWQNKLRAIMCHVYAIHFYFYLLSNHSHFLLIQLKSDNRIVECFGLIHHRCRKRQWRESANLYFCTMTPFYFFYFFLHLTRKNSKVSRCGGLENFTMKFLHILWAKFLWLFSVYHFRPEFCFDQTAVKCVQVPLNQN